MSHTIFFLVAGVAALALAVGPVLIRSLKRRLRRRRILKAVFTPLPRGNLCNRRGRRLRTYLLLNGSLRKQR